MFYRYFVMLLASVLAASPALAGAPAGEVQLRGDVKVEKTVVDNGVSRTVLADPGVVVPGDRLVFTTSYANGGRQPVTDFVVTNPLPGPVSLSPDNAAGLTVSVDGAKSWGLLATLKVPDGKGGLRPAVAKDVTHIRWTIARIAPGAAGKVAYNAIVK